MAVHVGIDFGTTNTALALAEDAGRVDLADLPGLSSVGEATTAKTWRTVLHFDPDAAPMAGAPAIARYVQNEGQGRLIQSIKSHLASASFTRTTMRAPSRACAPRWQRLASRRSSSSSSRSRPPFATRPGWTTKS